LDIFIGEDYFSKITVFDTALVFVATLYTIIDANQCLINVTMGEIGDIPVPPCLSEQRRHSLLPGRVSTKRRIYESERMSQNTGGIVVNRPSRATDNEVTKLFELGARDDCRSTPLACLAVGN
jgi:hypothetical protein